MTDELIDFLQLKRQKNKRLFADKPEHNSKSSSRSQTTKNKETMNDDPDENTCEDTNEAKNMIGRYPLIEPILMTHQNLLIEIIDLCIEIGALHTEVQTIKKIESARILKIPLDEQQHKLTEIWKKYHSLHMLIKTKYQQFLNCKQKIIELENGPYAAKNRRDLYITKTRHILELDLADLKDKIADLFLRIDF